MPFYKCTLVRSFIVEVEANNPEDAAQAADLFVGYSDDSTEAYRKQYQFHIQSIEMVTNDVLEIEQIESIGEGNG